MTGRILHWGPAIVYAGLIFWLSSQSQPLGQRIQADFMAHFLEYAVFAALLVWGGTSGLSKPLTLRRAVWLFLFVVLYAASDEFHQSYVPYRDPSLHDLAADSLGAGSALLAAYGLLPRLGRKSDQQQ